MGIEFIRKAAPILSMLASTGRPAPDFRRLLPLQSWDARPAGCFVLNRRPTAVGEIIWQHYGPSSQAGT